MEDLGKEMMAELLPVMGAILTAVVTYSVSLLAKRFKIQLNDEHQMLVRFAVRKAISGAEEWAARKANVETQPVDGAQKAVWVKDRLKAMFPKMTSEQLDAMIDEELGAIKGVGATREKGLDV
jgi:hypothetical protein